VSNVADKHLCQEARDRAEEVVLANAAALGLVASAVAYQQVWARESVIGGLGLWRGKSPEGAATTLRSLATLELFQSSRGLIPHNVGEAGLPDPALVEHGGALAAEESPDGHIVIDHAHAGCVDSNLWFILGHYYAVAHDGDVGRVKASWPALQKAHTWLAYQDSNECGLLEVHEAMDWADLYANRYNTLLANVLWYAATKAMASLAVTAGHAGEEFSSQADDIRQKINLLLWVGRGSSRDYEWIRRNRMEWHYPCRLTDIVLQDRPHYLAYMAFRDYGDRFDALGNLLAILFGVANDVQTERILDYIHAAGIDQPWPIKANYPPVRPGDKDWRDYYLLRNLNKPDQYHNGGIWPYLGGFYVAALVKAGRDREAELQLGRLAQMARESREADGSWDFNEWFHGASGRPMGFPHQTWSAAMYIYAHDAVEHGRPAVFNSDHGW
jgi:glycogen debranching enzyme